MALCGCWNPTGRATYWGSLQNEESSVVLFSLLFVGVISTSMQSDVVSDGDAVHHHVNLCVNQVFKGLT